MMPQETLTLIDQNSLGVSFPQRHQLGGFQIDFFQGTEGKSAGVWQLHVSANGWSSTWVPTRGMGLAQVDVGGFPFGWQSPVRGPVHPQWVPVFEPSGLGWLDGFDELLVRCGVTSNGAPQFNEQHQLELPLHGRIANLPAEFLSLQLDKDGRLVIQAEVYETRFHFDKWNLTTILKLDVDRPRIEVTDRVTNLAGTRRDCQMLYHFNLGAPLLDAGSRIDVPLEMLVPRNAHSAENLEQWDVMPDGRAGESEQVFFGRAIGDEQGRSLAMVANEGSNRAAKIEFQIAALPYFNLWKNPADSRDGYVVGLEPATNFPNPKRFESEQGRTVWLEANQAIDFNWAIEFSKDESNIASWRTTIADLQAQRECTIVREPKSDWCA